MGYRRIAALLKRERRSAGRQPVNAKRIFRLMKKHGLLLQRYPADADQASTTARSSPSAQKCRCLVGPAAMAAAGSLASPGNWQGFFEACH
jgi:hypothetical protein